MFSALHGNFMWSEKEYRIPSIFDYDDETTAHDVVKAMNPMNESHNQTIHIFS